MNCELKIDLPGSKSIAARALVCRLLSGHDTRIGNLPSCGDTDGMLRLTGAVRQSMQSGTPASVDIGEGGTTLRFGMAACASLPGLDITLAGSPKLMQRPHTTLIEALSALGAEISTIPEENAIHIHGRELEGGEVSLDGSVSSQYLSALMLAAPVWKNDTLFRLRKPVVSYPYIAMTAGVMRAFGAYAEIAECADHLEIRVKATGYPQCARYDVEGDWSGASYFFEAKLIINAQCAMHGAQSGDIRLSFPTLKAPAESLQGDSRVAAIFADATRRLAEKEGPVMEMDLNDAPDLVPAVAVGFCLAGIPFRISGVAHLRHKECDRMDAISSEMRRLGYELECGDDSMSWMGEKSIPESAPLIRTYKDHRMAMAFAPARLLFPTLRIENPGVVAKSFPRFWEEIAKILTAYPPSAYS